MTTNPTTLDTKFDYSVNLTNAQNSVAIVATATATGAVVTVKKDGKVPDDVTAIAIDEGDNTITVDVLAPDFVAMQTYTVMINRARGNASDDDALSSLSLSDGMLMPAFDVAALPAGDGTSGIPTPIHSQSAQQCGKPHCNGASCEWRDGKYNLRTGLFRE